MKSSEVLRAARVFIKDYREEFLCQAIGKVLGGYWQRRGSQVGRAIIESLAPYGTVDTWLSYAAEDFKDVANMAGGYNSPGYELLMREYRLRWIDWMIEGYERIGD